MNKPFLQPFTNNNLLKPVLEHFRKPKSTLYVFNRSLKLGFLVLTLLVFSSSVHANSNTNNPTLVADYHFNGDFGSSVAGAPNIQFLGADLDFRNENVLGINTNVFKLLVETGFRLDVSNLITNNEYSIAIVFKILSTQRYVKFLDFKNLLSDNGLYSYVGKLIFFPDVEGINVDIEADQYLQLIFTRDANGLTRGYVNKQLQFEFTDSGQDALLSSENLLHILIDDTTTASIENSDATIARLSVFNQALDAVDIEAFPVLDTIYMNGFE